MVGTAGAVGVAEKADVDWVNGTIGTGGMAKSVGDNEVAENDGVAGNGS